MVAIPDLTCTWCDAEEQQKKCHTCRDGTCRRAKLRNRTWNMTVTNNTGFVCVATANNAAFQSVNACCDRIRAGCGSQVDRNGIYRWRRYEGAYNSITQKARYCGNPTANECYQYGPITVCNQTYQYAQMCVLGWRMVTTLSSADLYISRTPPRYNCEPDRCQYRLALVIDGTMGLSWANQVTSGSNVTSNSSASFCGETDCPSRINGVWPISSLPSFDPNQVPVTQHAFRFVLRRSVDVLEFPMVFDATGAVEVTCGPKCASSIGSISLNLSDPPAFECSPPSSLPPTTGTLPNPETPCQQMSCEELMERCAGLLPVDFQASTNTLISSSDSGVMTPGSLPNPFIPASWTVDLS
jgi:hypothetical protein